MNRTSALAIEWLILLAATNLASFGVGLFVFATDFAPFDVIINVNPGIGVAIGIGLVLAVVWIARLVMQTSAQHAKLDSSELT